MGRADPHDFEPSAQEVGQIGDADLLITNGADFEEGLLDVIDSAVDDGVPTFEAITAVETLEFGEDAHNDEHADEDGHDDHGHDGDDPHFFTDPARMALAADAIVDFLIANVEGIDADELESNATPYIDDLEALSTEAEETLSEIPEDGRVLITNHEVFAYFADRYNFEVAGTVIPSGSSADGTSAQELNELAEVIEAEGVPAIFTDTSSSDELAQTLAAEVGEVAIVELFTESLGTEDSEGATYIAMVRTNAERIAAALTN